MNKVIQRGSLRRLGAAAILLAMGLASPLVQAASATASASFDGIFDVRTSGTATAVFTGFELLEAIADTTLGVHDGLSNGETFDSYASPFGEGTATNSGAGGATSFADSTDGVISHAHTFADIEIKLAGTGTVEIDFAFDLFVDAFDNLPDAFAIAGIEISSAFASPLFAEVEVLGMPGPGDSDAAAGILTMVLAVDTPLLDPLFDVVVVHTFADAASSPVPVPAAVWLLGSALVGIAGYRRRA